MRLLLTAARTGWLARGLVALLVQGLRGERAETLLALDPAQVARAAGLVGALSPSRVNGLGAMIRLMQRQLAEAGVAAEAAATVARVAATSTPSKKKKDAARTHDTNARRARACRREPAGPCA